jgi:hypothetical protein
MRFKSIFVWTVVSACAAVVLTACSTTVIRRSPGKKIGHGPPPHAPAHGCRRKMPAGVEVVYDSGCGVYVVVGWEDHYYLEGNYFRFRDGRWEVSVGIESGWKAVGYESVPPGLRGKHKDKHVSKANRGRGSGLAKKKW